MSLHVSKLRGIDTLTRARLKKFGIHYSDRLIVVAGKIQERQGFAARSRIDEVILWRLVRRADLARVRGIGAIFADLLELSGVDRVSRLALEDPAALHHCLRELNARDVVARRSPTLEEVTNWVDQARALPKLVEGDDKVVRATD